MLSRRQNHSTSTAHQSIDTRSKTLSQQSIRKDYRSMLDSSDVVSVTKVLKLHILERKLSYFKFFSQSSCNGDAAQTALGGARVHAAVQRVCETSGKYATATRVFCPPRRAHGSHSAPAARDLFARPGLQSAHVRGALRGQPPVLVRVCTRPCPRAELGAALVSPCSPFPWPCSVQA